MTYIVINRTLHALAQCTAVKVAIKFALKEKWNLLLSINDSDFMLETGICRGLFVIFFFNK